MPVKQQVGYDTVPREFKSMIYYCGAMVLVDEDGNRYVNPNPEEGDGNQGSCSVFWHEGQTWCLSAAHVLAAAEHWPRFGISCLCKGSLVAPAPPSSFLKTLVRWRAGERPDFSELKARQREIDAARFLLADYDVLQRTGFRAALVGPDVKVGDTVLCAGTPKSAPGRRQEGTTDILPPYYLEFSVEDVYDSGGALILRSDSDQEGRLKEDLAGMSGCGVFNVKGDIVGVVHEQIPGSFVRRDDPALPFQVGVRFYHMSFVLENA